MENNKTENNKMENNKKESNKKENNSFINLIKKNYKLIIVIIITLVLIGIIIISNNTNINFKKNNKGGALATQVATSGLTLYGRLASKCTTGAFIQSAQRFNAIIDNLKFVIVLILAIVLIPAFPIVFYITTVYVIIYSLVGNMIKS